MKKKAWQLSIPIILIAAVVATGLLMKDNGPGSVSTKIKNSVEKISGLKPWQPSGTLVYESDGKVIYQNLSEDTRDSYKLPTDNVSLTTSSNGTLLLLEPTNQKWNRGKNVADLNAYNLSANSLPVISPDSNKIAYLAFSNAEKGYGYNIMVIGGDDTKSYYSNENQISFLRWSDNNTLVFAVSGKENSIETLDIGTQKVSSVAAIKNTIKALSANNGIVVISTDASKNNVIAYDIKNTKQTLSKTNKDCIDILLNSDGKMIAYINGESKIEIYNMKDGNKKILNKADKLIGWY